MARKKKLNGIAIDNFKLENRDYVIGDKYSTTNRVRFELMINNNLIKNNK
tara:strand:- start:6372 stop:6521 length:150 start_codon:yes stop_codon:yes gene_type:complete